MSESFNSKFLDDPQFQSLLVACLESLQRGEVIDRDSLSRDYPQYAAEVNQFLEDRQLLEQVAAELQDVDSSNVAITAYEKTLGAHDAGDFELNERIRYIGEYEILDEVARGGMGIVFKAKQQSLGRIVALKMILSGRLADEGDVERFQREAKAAGRLKHSHIVPVHEIGEFEGRQYFTMDFVDGQSLAEIVRDETLAPKRAASLIQMVAEAVDYAHQRDIVHRDLKPANILIDAHDEPQITDFGLAKILESVDDESKAELTASGQILGTPSYMSPEQASGNQDLVNQSSDIYSLGAILYACLTGRAPFVADSPVDTLLQVIHKDPVSPRDLNPAVPKDLETICLKCLNKKQKSRYGSAQELADDLTRFCEGRPVAARPVSKLSKLVRWCGRNQAVASLIATVMVSMALGTTISMFYANAANEYAKSEAAQHLAAEEARAEAEAQRDAANRARELAEQRGKDLRRQLYVAQMPRALEEWKSGNTAGTKQLLAQHIPDEGEEELRGFEWHWLDNLTRSSRIKVETGRRIVAADISPSGELIATVGEGKLLIHRLDTGERIHEFRVPGAGVSGVSFDSSGDYLAVGHANLQLWSLKEKSLVWERPLQSGGFWVAITADDRLVLSACVEWGDGSGSTQIQMRDFKTGTLIREIEVPSAIYAAKINPFSDSIAMNCHDNNVRILDIESGMLVKEWSQGGALHAISYSPDGQWLTLGTKDGTLFRYDALSGKRVETWRKQPNSFLRVATAPEGRTVAAAGAPQVVYLYDFETGEPVSEFRGHAAEIIKVQFRPATQEVVTCDLDGVIHAWDTRQEQGFVSFDGDAADLSSAEFSDDGRWLACAEGISWKKEQKGVVRLHDFVDSGSNHILDGHESGVFGVALANKRVYSAGYDGRLICWDLESREQLESRTFEKPLTSLAVSRDGGTKAVGTFDGKILVLHGGLETSIQEFSLGYRNWEVQHVDLSPDGRFLAANDHEDLRVWDLDENRQVVKLRNRRVRALAFNERGDRLAAGADGNVIVYDTTTWEVVHELKAHSEPVLGISFHPSGKQLVTRSADATVKIWEMETWQNVLSLSLPNKNRSNLFAPVFSPDGTLLLAYQSGDKVRFLTTTDRQREQSTLDTEDLIQRAYSLTRTQRWPEAFAAFEKILEANIGDPKWMHAHAAEIASYIPQTELTKQRIQNSAKLARDFRDTDIFLASRLILSAQILPDMDPDPKLSLQIARQAWNEISKQGSIVLVHTLFRQGRDEEVVDFINNHRGEIDYSTAMQLLHSASLYRLGQIEAANSVFDKAANSYGQAKQAIGRGRIFAGEYFSNFLIKQVVMREVSEIALRSLNDAIETRPDNADLIAYRGLLHRRWHRWEKAFTDLQRAVEMKPDNVDYCKAAAICATLTNRYDEADRLAEQAIQLYLDSNNTDEFWSAARIASRIPNATFIDNQLLMATQQSADRYPQHSWRQLAVVGVLHRLGHHERALEMLSQIQTKYPNYNAITKGAFQFRRGLILYDQENVQEATKALIRGETLGRSSMQPPGVFPYRGQETFVDFIALGKELKNVLDHDSQSRQDQANAEHHGSDNHAVGKPENSSTEKMDEALNDHQSDPSSEAQGDRSSDRSPLKSVFIYDKNKQVAQTFRELVKPFWINAEIVPVQGLSSQLLSEADLVVVGSDTAAAWENSSASQMIRNAQIPVLAMGQGGYRFFGGLELEIGSPHGNHGTTTSLRPDEEAIFWDAFQPVPVDGLHNCYTEAQCISIKLKESRDNVFLIAAEPDRENLYPLIAQKPYYVFWGFDGQLDQLTRTGRHLLPWACHYTVAMKRNPEQAFQSVSEVKRIREKEKSASDTR